MDYFIIHYKASVQVRGKEEEVKGIIGIMADTDALLSEKASSHLSAIYRREYEGCDDVRIVCEEISKVTEARYRELSFNFKT